MSLLTLKRRVEKLESIRTQKSQHVVVVFEGTDEADEQARHLIADAQEVAVNSGKVLQIIRISGPATKSL